MTSSTTNLASVDFSGAVTDGFRNIATFVPKLLGFLVILLVGYLIATLIAKVVDRVLERTGFDNAVERGGIKKALDKSKYDASDLVAKLVFFAIFIPVLSAAIGVLGIAALTQPLAAFIALIPKIIVAIVLVVVGAALAGLVKNLVQSSLGGLSYAGGLGTAAGALVFVLFAKAALDEVGIAENVTNAVLYTALAIVAGVTIVGVGGGLIKPMQQRWDGILDKAQDEARNIKSQTSAPTAYPADPVAGAPYDQQAYTGARYPLTAQDLDAEPTRTLRQPPL